MVSHMEIDDSTVKAMGDMYSAERFPRLVRSLPMDGHKVSDWWFC